jgi:hypothetical protein
MKIQLDAFGLGATNANARADAPRMLGRSLTILIFQTVLVLLSPPSQIYQSLSLSVPEILPLQSTRSIDAGTPG